MKAIALNTAARHLRAAADELKPHYPRLSMLVSALLRQVELERPTK